MIRKTKNNFGFLLAWISLFQFILGSVILQSHLQQPALANPPPVTEAAEAHLDMLLQSQEGSAVPKPVDTSFHVKGQQLWELEVEVKQDGFEILNVSAQHSLNALNVAIPTVRITSPFRQLRYFYDKNNRRLILLKLEQNAKVGQRLKTYAHVINDIDITSNLFVDPGFLAFATIGGTIQGTIWPMLMNSLFAAPIPLMTLAEPPPIEGIEVTGITVLDRDSEPREIKEWSDAETAITDFLVGDFAITVHSPEQPDKDFEAKLDRSAVAYRISLDVLRLTMLIVLANPDLEFSDDILRIFSDHQDEIQAMLTSDPLFRSADLGQRDSYLTAAMRHIGQRVDPKKVLAPLKKDINGNTEFKRLADGRRETVPVTDWPKEFAHIQQVTRALARAAQELGRDPLNWQEALTVYSKLSRDLDPELDPYSAAFDPTLIQRMEAAYSNEDRPEKMAAVWKSHEQRIKWLALKNITKKSLRVLGVAVGTGLAVKCGDAVCTQLTGWSPTQWGLTLGSDLLNQGQVAWHHIASLWGVRDVVNPMIKGKEFFTDSFRTWGVIWGGVATSMLIPLSLFGAKTLSKFFGYPWNAFKAFFTFGMKYAGILNYPPMKLAWDAIGAKFLYPSLAANIDPLEHKAAMTPGLGRFFGSPQKREEAAAAVRASVEEEAIRKNRSLLIAAALQAKKSHHSIITLLNMAQGAQIEELLSMAQDIKGTGAKLAPLAVKVDRELKRLDDAGAGEVSEADIQPEYIALFERLAGDLRAAEERGPKARAALAVADWIGDTAAGYAHETSRFLLFGKQLYLNHLTFKNIEMSPHQVRKAANHYIVDYEVTLLLNMITRPEFYYGIPHLGADGWKGWGHQGEQNLLYGAFAGQEALVTEAAKAFSLSNPYKPLIDSLMSGARARSQGLLASIRTVFERAALDPDAPSVFNAQLGSMNNALANGTTRLLAGWPMRAGAMLGAAWTAHLIPSLNPMTTGAVFASSFMILQAAINQLTMNFAKMTPNFGPLYGGMLNNIAPGSGSVLMGYTCFVWPPTYWAQDLNKERLDKNLNRIQAADFNATEGIRLGRQDLIYKGISDHIAILREGGMIPPAEFADLTEAQCTPVVGRRFMAVSVSQRPALATTQSHSFDLAVNLWGSILSTGLAAPWSRWLLSPEVPVSHQLLALGGAVGSIAIAHPLIKLAPRFTVPASAALRARCQRMLSRKQP